MRIHQVTKSRSGNRVRAGELEVHEEIAGED